MTILLAEDHYISGKFLRITQNEIHMKFREPCPLIVSVIYFRITHGSTDNQINYSAFFCRYTASVFTDNAEPFHEDIVMRVIGEQSYTASVFTDNAERTRITVSPSSPLLIKSMIFLLDIIGFIQIDPPFNLPDFLCYLCKYGHLPHLHYFSRKSFLLEIRKPEKFR